MISLLRDSWSGNYSVQNTAYRCNISTRVSLVAQQSPRPSPYIVDDNDHKLHSHSKDKSQQKLSNFSRQGLLGSITNTSGELSSVYRERRCSPFSLQRATGYSFLEDILFFIKHQKADHPLMSPRLCLFKCSILFKSNYFKFISLLVM